MLRTLNAGSAHLFVTSPPYDDVRRYGGHSWDFEPLACEIHRVLCEGGALCWNVCDMIVDGSESLSSAKQKIFFREQCGFRIHQTLYYQKRNFSHPDRSRYHRVTEQVIVLAKGKLRAWSPIVDRKNLTAGCVGNLGVNSFTERDGSKSVRPKKVTAAIGKRHDAWLGKTRGQEEMCKALPHAAMMPKWLARDLIASYSNPGDIVIDPMAGSGTTAVAALSLGRRAVAIDINPEYAPLIESAISGKRAFTLDDF